MKKTVITANMIIKLLAHKHNEDIFVSECKDGPTVYGSSLRLDGWAMKKSWASPSFIGYEIKVSRGDFLQDEKWTDYLDYCTQFYFVAPKGVVDIEELPSGIGLIQVASTGTRLFTKRKAAPRQIDMEKLDGIFRYILMNRCKIVDSQFNLIPRKSDKEYWQQWLENKKLDSTFGLHVSKAIRKAVDEQIDKTQNENDKLKVQIEIYRDLHEKLVECGYVEGELGKVSRYSFSGIQNKILDVIPSDQRRIIQRAHKALSDLNDLTNHHSGGNEG
ncbi:MAG: MmcB family DNA repair protein [Candidatus Peribacteraceae bacterium]|nr:MmcB family DNA repair protein [Candidatus Peribacteraceae bacterium]